MTAVIAINCLSEIVALADTRVSSPGSVTSHRDILRKLYVFGTEGKSVVFGFSGNLEAARAVFLHICEGKLPRYRRRFVIPEFKDSLGSWIQEATSRRLSPGQREGLAFILAGIEPSRHPRISRNGHLVGFLNLPEVHIYQYRVRRLDGTVTATRKPWFAIIGSGNLLQKQVSSKLKEAIGFGFAQPNLHWGRAVLMAEIMSCLYATDASLGVGGPIQAIRIAPSGVDEQFAWPPGVPDRNMQVRREHGRIFLSKPGSDEELALHPIWDLPGLGAA